MPNGVDEGLTLGLPTVVIIACFCRVVWVFQEILADVTGTIYTLSSTNGEHMFLVNQDEFLSSERTIVVHPVKLPLPDPISDSSRNAPRSFFLR
jgi:hypothetical protein